MSISSDGILFYGIMLNWEDGEEPWADDEDGDHEEWLANKLGISDREPKHEVYTSDDWKSYWKYKREQFALLGVEFVLHCSYDYSMWGIAVSESLSNASRGEPKEIKSTDIKPEWANRLKSFCESVGIGYEEPKWWLTSLMG